MESRITIIETDYTKYLVSIVRDKKSKRRMLKKAMYSLGFETGKSIFSKFCVDMMELQTPMKQMFSGVVFNNSLSVIVSTRNDHMHFAKGCLEVLQNSLVGYMDFGNARGKEVFTSPLRAISLPEIPKNSAILNLIVLKSILATGCTAISLTRRSLEIYRPKNLIIASVFYSDEGLRDLIIEFPNANIILFDKADKLDKDGMLIPGVGNLDKRMGF